MNIIKLIIWDLDETLWKGTLSEGEVICTNAPLIEKISKHGIINSISSKNDFENAKSKLIEIGIWDYFVFPSINWNPKGKSVKQIIENCQLRPVNVIFVDDNPSNIKEVEFYNPGIITANNIDDVIKLIDFSYYKQDLDLKRLSQYKILENKKKYQELHNYSNIDFLRSSNIKIEIIRNLSDIKERLIDMISRTNQLNYTKLRINMKELDSLINNNNIECAAIHVKDKFGDYGISGFYALDTHTHTLKHFLFSCRILNLGVEKYIYNKLGRPQITIIEPVSTKLNDEVIDWVSESKIDKKNINKKAKRLKLMMLGGCDLEQMCHYFPENKFEIIKDFNYNGANNIAIHREHTVFIKKVNNITNEEFNILQNLPFLDDKILKFNFIKSDYDYLIYSPLMNYTQEIYRHKFLNFDVAYGGYTNILHKNSVSNFSQQDLKDFKNNFIFMGQQSSDDFTKDLEWLVSIIKKPIIFLNGAEINFNNPNEIGAYERHKIMNHSLELFVSKHRDQCTIVDVNKYVKNYNDLTDNIRHYQRKIYIDLAKEIIELTTGEKIKSFTLLTIKYYSKKIYNKLLKMIINKPKSLF